MAMFLSGTSVIIIMRVGRWSSEAFLEYIRDQVEMFTLDVSKNMLQVEEFCNLNTTTKTSQLTTKPLNKNIASNEKEKENNTRNEDGPDSVPFSIRFNRLALNSGKRSEK